MQTNRLAEAILLRALQGATLLAVLFACSAGPEIDREPNDGACSGCTIGLQHLVTLQVNEMTRPIAGSPTDVVSGPAGERIVFHPGQAPSLFDADGRFVQEIGGLGQGPGEFQVPVHAAYLPGDSILVLDVAQLRATVLDPALNAVRTISLPVMAGAAAVLRWPDRVAVAGTAFVGEHAGWPVHLVDMSGESAVHLAAAGESRVAVREGQPGVERRTLAAGDAESFWAAQLLAYRIARISASGDVLETISRTPEWFGDIAPYAHGGSPTVPPPSMLRKLAARGDTLWLAFSVARPDWRRAWDRVVIPSSGELTASNSPETTELTMGRIEAIDARSGALLASREVDGLVVGLDDRANAVVYDLDGNLLPRLRVMRLSIEGAP